MTETIAPIARPEPPPPAPPRGGGRWWQDELRPLLHRVHFYAGLLVAPFVLVAALTGLLYTATPQLEELIHHDQLHVPIPPAAAQRPLQQQVQAALAALPGGTVSEIRPPIAADGTTRVLFDVPGLPDGYGRTVFVDPYTGAIRGILTTYGEWLPVRAWFDELHRTLHLGPVGECYSELAASWLWVLTLSGLAMWFSRRRRARRQLVLPRLRGSGRVRLLSWHGSLGLWVAVVLLFLSATGLTWSQFAGAHVTQLRHALTWSTPAVHTALPSTAPTSKPTSNTPATSAPGTAVSGSPTTAAPGASAAAAAPVPTRDTVAAQADRVLTVARAHGLTDPVALDPPTEPGHAWTAQQVKRSWPEKQDSLAISVGPDAATGTVVDRIRFADWPIAAKLARWGIDAHMTLLFGLANQIALALVAAGLLVMIAAAYRMWWRARPRPGTAARPGFPTLAGAAVVAVAVGLALPALGASLLAFLLLDALLTTRTPAAA